MILSKYLWIRNEVNKQNSLQTKNIGIELIFETKHRNSVHIQLIVSHQFALITLLRSKQFVVSCKYVVFIDLIVKYTFAYCNKYDFFLILHANY